MSIKPRITNVNAIKFEEKREEKLKKMHYANQKKCKSEEERKIFDLGDELGFEAKPIPDEYKDSLVFLSGYERGIRRYKINEFQKNKQIVEKMVEQNIPFENAPEEIKSSNELQVHYLLYSLQHNSPKSNKTK